MNRLSTRTRRRSAIGAILVAALTAAGFVNLAGTSASAQRRTTAARRTTATRKPVTKYSKGYTAGYSAGYAAGKSDWTQQSPADYQRHGAFEPREGTADQQLLSSEDYKQGYNLGFQIAYLDGYYGRLRNAAIPTNAAVLGERLAQEQAAQAHTQAQAQSANPDQNQGQNNQGQNQPDAQRDPQQQPAGDPQGDPRDRRRYSATAVDIPNGTEMRIKLTSPIDTRTSHIGDQFTAEVIMPSDYEGGTIEGHLLNIKKSGRVSGKTELSLTFDNITLRDGRRGKISAQLVKIFESESVKKVDEEGKVQSGDRTRDSEVRGGVGAAVGAIIGGIAGGGRGAVVGILLGGAAGVGTVYVEGDKDLVLDRGTEMVIRTDRSRKGSN